MRSPWEKRILRVLFLSEEHMPHKPLKPCRYAGCPNLTEETYCPIHRKLVNQKYNRYQRNQEAQSFYNSSAWRKLRARFLIEHPFCVECRKNGKLTKATVVDHVVPIRQGGPAFEENNLQALCASCHGSKSIKEGSRYG